MTKESKRYLEGLSEEAREFLIFLYKRFGRGDFSYSDVKREVSKILYHERQRRFGCYNEKQLSKLFNKFKVLERRPSISRGKKKIHNYNLKKEVAGEVEDLIKTRSKNN